MIYTTDGKKYLDMISGLSVMNMGHGSVNVSTAVNEQLKKHAHVMVYGEYAQSAPEKLARTLTSLLPKSLDSCYFLNSGTEAIEAAIKLCRRSTGRSELIAFNGSYHGASTGSLAISSNFRFRTYYRKNSRCFLRNYSGRCRNKNSKFRFYTSPKKQVHRSRCSSYLR